MAASDRFRVTIKGRTAHAGHPHEGVDAILAAADFLQEVSHIVSRRVSPLIQQPSMWEPFPAGAVTM